MSKKLPSPEEHHEIVVKGLYDQMKPVFDSSEQPIFLYLDDNHKACNSKFAKMLGFNSPQEWAKTPSVLGESVAEKSQEIVTTAYWDTMKKKIASTIQVTWMNKDGGTFNSTVVMVPMFFDGHMFAVHFITSTVNK
jgi:carbohydrate-binding DOMON domain-containing protein